MKLDPEPTKAEIRIARTYCVIAAVFTGIPAVVALQLKGLLSWQFFLCVLIVLFFLLAAFAFPARVRVAFVRFAPWP